LCRRCTHGTYSTSKLLKVSPEKSQILSWHCCGKWAIYYKKQTVPKYFTSWIYTMRARNDHTPSIYKTLLHSARKYTYAADTIGTFKTYSIV
jgi:hypothetical protein